MIFSAIVPEKIYVFWGMYAILSAISSLVTRFRSLPNISTVPEYPCTRRNSILTNVDLPHPEAPAMPIFSPFRIDRLMLCKTHVSSLSGYEKSRSLILIMASLSETDFFEVDAVDVNEISDGWFKRSYRSLTLMELSCASSRILWISRRGATMLRKRME